MWRPFKATYLSLVFPGRVEKPQIGGRNDLVICEVAMNPRNTHYAALNLVHKRVVFGCLD